MTETNKPKRAGGGEKEIRFFVPGEPKGKGRPRFTGTGRTYALNGLAYYDDAQIVEWHFRKQYGADPGVEINLSIIEEEP